MILLLHLIYYYSFIHYYLMNQLIIILFHWLYYDLFVYLTWIWLDTAKNQKKIIIITFDFLLSFIYSLLFDWIHYIWMNQLIIPLFHWLYYDLFVYLTWIWLDTAKKTISWQLIDLLLLNFLYYIIIIHLFIIIWLNSLLFNESNNNFFISLIMLWFICLFDVNLMMHRDFWTYNFV